MVSQSSSQNVNIHFGFWNELPHWMITNGCRKSTMEGREEYREGKMEGGRTRRRCESQVKWAIFFSADRIALRPLIGTRLHVWLHTHVASRKSRNSLYIAPPMLLRKLAKSLHFVNLARPWPRLVIRCNTFLCTWYWVYFVYATIWVRRDSLRSRVSLFTWQKSDEIGQM